MVLEIVAILAAAAWALSRLYVEDAPGLGERATIEAKLGWDQIGDQRCEADYEVQFQNIGKTNIKIQMGRLSVWRLSYPGGIAPTDLVTYIDPLTFRQGAPLYQREIDRFNQDYAPGIKDSEGFTFLVKKEKDMRLLFQVELWSPADAS